MIFIYSRCSIHGPHFSACPSPSHHSTPACTCVTLLINCFSRDINKVNDGMGHKIALFVQSLAMVFGGFAMGFAYGWKLTLVILALSPLIAIAGALLGKVCKKPHSH